MFLGIVAPVSYFFTHSFRVRGLLAKQQPQYWYRTPGFQCDGRQPDAANRNSLNHTYQERRNISK